MGERARAERQRGPPPYIGFYLANIDDRRAAQREGIVAYLRGLTNGQILDTAAPPRTFKIRGTSFGSGDIGPGYIMGNRFLDWRSSRGERVFLLVLELVLCFFIPFLETVKDESMISVVHFEGRKVSWIFFFFFFCCGFLKIFNGVLQFEGVKVLWILFSVFSWKSWKIGDFSFCRSGDFFFLSFLFLCNFLGSWRVDDWNYSFWERIDIFSILSYIFIFEINTSSTNYCFKK